MTGDALCYKFFEIIRSVSGPISSSEQMLLQIIAHDCAGIRNSIKFGSDYTFALQTLIDWNRQFPRISELGQAFWKVSLQCNDGILKLVLHLCAVTCMHNIARIKLCIILQSFDSNIEKALSTNSLLELVEAVNNVEKHHQMTEEQRLIIAFLREYPACVAPKPKVVSIAESYP
jgi:hypothetical protein